MPTHHAWENPRLTSREMPVAETIRGPGLVRRRKDAGRRCYGVPFGPRVGRGGWWGVLRCGEMRLGGDACGLRREWLVGVRVGDVSCGEGG